jgi:hypothetical protein
MNKIIVDQSGNMLFNTGDGKRTPLTHPYNYDPFVIWENGEKSTSTVYSDRMHGWDYAKYNECSTKVFGDNGQLFDKRDPIDIERFLRLYFDRPDLILCCITQHCNQSTGYPLWRFEYR